MSQIDEQLIQKMDEPNTMVEIRSVTQELTEIINHPKNFEDNSKSQNIVENSRECASKQETGEPKPKRKRTGMLGIDVSNETVNEDEYAMCENGNIYRKYKLREKKIVKQEINDDIIDKNENDDILDEYSKDDTGRYCFQCKKEFNSKTGLLNHMRIHTKIDKIVCSICKEQFKNQQELAKHKLLHESEEQPYLCLKCKSAFTEHSDYLIHCLSHSNKKYFRCEECGMGFSDKNKFKYHLKTHTTKRVQCEICSKKVKPVNLSTHISSHTMFECVECGKECKGAKIYKYHMSTHTGVKLYQCLYCGKGFGTKSQKNVHTRVHTDERPYECKECHQKFRQQTDLLRHMNKHTETRFECDYCKRKYTDKNYLMIHMRTHLAKSLFPCKQCGKSFFNINGLKAHTMYKHVKERPYSCHICNMSFADKGSLIRHETSKFHKNKLYGYNIKNDVPMEM